MNWIEPKRLASGMTIGIMAPASASDEDLHKIEEICASKAIRYSGVIVYIVGASMVVLLRTSYRVSIYDDYSLVMRCWPCVVGMVRWGI